MLKDIEDNSEEDGYDIIRRFVTKYERSCRNIQKHKSSEYCRELIEKYYPYFPAWVFVELISFGDLVKLYEYYIERYPGRLKDSELLYSIRDLRNATAHSNCLINKLQKGTNKPSVKIIKFVSNIDGRAVKNKEYFEKNECIKTAYFFVKKVVDYINEAC